MTIIEAINEIDSVKPNDYTQTEKIKWLSNLDSMIKKEVIDTHEGSEDISFDGYTDQTPIETILLVESPYDTMYIAWLESKIDYHNSEYTRYNNSITNFNDLYTEYVRYYNRTHMPKAVKLKNF